MTSRRSGELAHKPDKRTEQVGELARALPPRAGKDEFDIDYNELDRRMDEVRRGRAILVPWIEARRQILRDQ